MGVPVKWLPTSPNLTPRPHTPLPEQRPFPQLINCRSCFPPIVYAKLWKMLTFSPLHQIKKPQRRVRKEHPCAKNY